MPRVKSTPVHRPHSPPERKAPDRVDIRSVIVEMERELMRKTVKQLKDASRAKGLSGYSRLTKKQIVKFLMDHTLGLSSPSIVRKRGRQSVPRVSVEDFMTDNCMNYTVANIKQFAKHRNISLTRLTSKHQICDRIRSVLAGHIIETPEPEHIEEKNQGGEIWKGDENEDIDWVLKINKESFLAGGYDLFYQILKQFTSSSTPDDLIIEDVEAFFYPGTQVVFIVYAGKRKAVKELVKTLAAEYRQILENLVFAPRSKYDLILNKKYKISLATMREIIDDWVHSGDESGEDES